MDFTNWPFKRTIIRVRSGEFRFPELIRYTLIPKVELRQLTPCAHALDIRDRAVDGGSQRRYWLQTDEADHRCASKYLLPVVSAILRERYGAVKDLEGTITLPKKGLRIADLTELLVGELPPYLNVQEVKIINYARVDETRPLLIVDADGNDRYRWTR
jgi:hypothetical protein